MVGFLRTSPARLTERSGTGIVFTAGKEERKSAGRRRVAWVRPQGLTRVSATGERNATGKRVCPCHPTGVEPRAAAPPAPSQNPLLLAACDQYPPGSANPS